MSTHHQTEPGNFQQAALQARQEIAAIANPERISFPLGSLEEAADHFAACKEFGFTYGRTATPENAALERLLKTMEGGVSAVALASGQAANFLTVHNLLPQQGDEIVASSRLFGGTASLLKNFLSATGRLARFADPINADNLRKEITPNTRALFVESVSNPDAAVADIEALSGIARAHHIPLVVDNTLAPLLSTPIVWGADIVTLSLTKFFNGKGNILGGAVIDAGTFPWKGDARWPALSGTRPQNVPSLADSFNKEAFSALIRQSLTLFGPSLNPADAIRIVGNAIDLEQRTQQQVKNTNTIADFLASHDRVEWVHYLGHENHPSHALLGKYLKAAPAILLFKPKGGYETAKTLIPALQLIGHEANIGYEKTLAIHSFDTTHRLFTPEQKAAARIEHGAIRLSVGTESPQALMNDLARALRP